VLEELGVLGAVTVIVPAQEAVWLLPPQVAAAVTPMMVCAVLIAPLMEVGLQVMPLVTALVPQFTVGLVGVCPVVIACVTELQVSLALTVKVPQVAVCPLQSPAFAVALMLL
jgi:hypothetical protein